MRMCCFVQSAEKEEYDSRRKELEDVAFPILQRANAAAHADAADASSQEGPTVEEKD